MHIMLRKIWILLGAVTLVGVVYVTAFAVDGGQQSVAGNDASGPIGPAGPHGSGGPEGRRGPPSKVWSSADGPCFDLGNRFVDCGNGTVTDTSTEIVWLKAADCLPASNYVEANLAAGQLSAGQCGLTDRSIPGDWRLPTRTEWETVVEQAVANDCDTPYFPDRNGLGCCGTDDCPFFGVQSAFHWSSTSDVSSPASAWGASLLDGIVMAQNPKTASNASVWPVRGGQAITDVGAPIPTIRILQLATPPVTGQRQPATSGTCVATGTLCQSNADCAVNDVCVRPPGHCAFQIQQWKATIEAVSEEIVMTDVTITYDWVNPIFVSPLFTAGLGSVSIPAHGTNQVRFLPIASDVLYNYPGIEGATATLTLRFRGVTLGGEEVTIVALANLLIEICT